MFKRLLTIILCLGLLTTVACSGNKGKLEIDKDTLSSDPAPIVSQFSVNPLTGLEDLDSSKLNQKPFALTINNIKVAQTVQTGLYAADIVYETEVEGGITRLVALFKDVSSLEKIGTIRSARYAFIDFAAGHNAVYLHHGSDYYHADPHLKDVDSFTVSEKYAGFREKNGLASEHTLFANGTKIEEAAKKAGIDLKTDKTSTWVNFADKTKSVTHATAAKAVTVPFSNSYKTTFKFDDASGKYVRYFNGQEYKDAETGENIKFKNVFVLNTTIKDYPTDPDGKTRRNIDLSSGDGYYCVNGTYTSIKWSKGSTNNGFVFTNTDGTPLEVNVGNSWVCVADKSDSQPIFE